MNQEKRLSMKQFIKQKKALLKTDNNQQDYTLNLIQIIQNSNVQDFQKAIKNMQKHQIIGFLFYEDALKETPLTKMIKSPQRQLFLQLSNQMVKSNYSYIKELVHQKWVLNELMKNDWQNKFKALNKCIIQTISSQNDENAKKQVANKLAIKFSTQENLILDMYEQFLTVNFISTCLPINKHSKIADDIIFLLQQYYLKLLQNNKQKNIFTQVSQYKNSLVKERVWQKQNFLDLIKKGNANQLTFALKELRFTFMHQLFLKQDNLQQIIQIYQHFQNLNDSENQIILKKLLTSFDSSDETPIDVGIRTWSASFLIKLLTFVKAHIEICLTTNCLNQILANKKLTQLQKQKFIQKCLSTQLSQRGFIEIIKVERLVQLTKGNKQKIQVYLEQDQTNSMIIYDKNKLLSQRNLKGSYPLLTYIDLYKSNSNLKIVELLFPHHLIDRKIVKVKITSLIKAFTDQKLYHLIEIGSQGHKELVSLFDYHYPILRVFCKLPQSQLSEHLCNKLYINCPELNLLDSEQKERKKLRVSRQFLAIYLQTAQQYGQTSKNKQVLNKIFNSKESQRIIKHYNMYEKLLYNLNELSSFRQNQNSFLQTQIRNELRKYFDQKSAQQLFRSDYFEQLSWCLFHSTKKNKYNKQKDWSLYNADQIVNRFYVTQKLNLQQYITHEFDLQQSAQQAYMLAPKLSLRSKRILRYIQGLSLQQQVEQQFDLQKVLLSTIRSKYRKTKQLKHFKQYIEKTMFQIQKLNINILRVKSNLKQIELSLFQTKLYQKILILLQNGLDFYFKKQDVQLVNVKQHDKSIQTIEQLFSVKGIMLKSSIIKQQKNYIVSIQQQNIKQICKIMVLNGFTFVNSIFYPHRFVCELKNLFNLFKNNKYDILIDNLFQNFKQLNQKQRSVISRSSYPINSTQPVSFETFQKIAQIIINLNEQQFFQVVTIEESIQNLIKNLQYCLSSLQVTKIQYQQLKHGNKAYKQVFQARKLSDNQTNKIKQIFAFGLKQIKTKLNYQKHVQKVVNDLKQNLINEIKGKSPVKPNQQKVQQQNNDDGPNHIYKKLIQSQQKNVDKIQQNQLNQQSQLNQQLSPQVSRIKYFYQVLGEKFLKKHHYHGGIDLKAIYQLLTNQQIFLIDRYLTSHIFCEGILVYKMQASTKPFQIFKSRAILQPLISKKNHYSLKSIFIEQLKRFTLQQFKQSIPLIEQSNFIHLGDILHQIKDQNKIIYLLDNLLQNKHSNKIKLTSLYLKGLLDENYPKLTISIILLIQKLNFNIRLLQGQSKQTLLICDNMSIYSKCSQQTFDKIFIKQMQKYLSSQSKIVSDQYKTQKRRQIIHALIDYQDWTRILTLISEKSSHSQRDYIQAVFQTLAKNTSILKVTLKEQNSKILIQKAFQIYKSLNLPFNEAAFIGAYKCNPQAAFQIFKPKQLKVQTMVSCLKAIPQHAKLFVDNHIETKVSQSPSQIKYYKTFFPITPYYYHNFGNCHWLLDLLRIQKKILTQCGHIHLLDKTMESLIILDKMQENFQQFYTEQQIHMKCKKLLNSNQTKSIKKYPIEWFQKHFANKVNKILYKTINLDIMQVQLVKQLIDFGYLQIDSIQRVIATCKFQTINCFLQKFSIKLTYQKIWQIQQEYMQPKYKKNIWNFLTQIQNQNFVCQFIKTYNLFEIYPHEKYQEILLNNIAIHRRNQILNDFIQYFTKKSGHKINYVFGQKGRIGPNHLITLPDKLAVQLNYYQYYFLVKTCGNECPDFFVSSRYLIESQNFIKSLQKVNFVPQLKRRLQILHILSITLNKGSELNFKTNTLMKSILNIIQVDLTQSPMKGNYSYNQTNNVQIAKSKQKQKIVQEKQKYKVSNNWLKSFQILIQFLIQPTETLLLTNPQGIFEKLIVLLLNSHKLCIKQTDLIKMHPADMKIIKSVQKFINKTIQCTKALDKVLQICPPLKALMLTNNFNYFMDNFKGSLTVQNSKGDNPLTYIKGVTFNIVNFENSKQKSEILNEYLTSLFCKDNCNFQSPSYSNYLKKYIFLISLISYSQGKNIALKTLQRIFSIKKQDQQSVLFVMASIMNERRKNQIELFQPFFDIGCWNNVIDQLKQISQLNKFIKDNKQTDSLKRLNDSCMNEVKQYLQKHFHLSKICNITNIFDVILLKVLQTQTDYIYKNLTLLMNSIRLLSSFSDLHTMIKDKIVSKNKTFRIELQIMNKQFKITQQSNDLNQEQNFKIRIAFSWQQTAKNLPLVYINIQGIQNDLRRNAVLKKIKLDPTIQKLTQKYENLQQSSFTNYKFKFNYQSLSKIQSFSILQKLTVDLPMTTNGVDIIINLLEEIDRKAFDRDNINTSFYSLDDVYGPVKLDGNNDQTKVDKVLNCLVFYQLLQLNHKEIDVQVQAYNSKSEKPQFKDLLYQQVQDFNKYLDYVKNQILENHPVGIQNPYKFNNEIKLLINLSTLQISVVVKKNSLINLLNIFSLSNSFSSQICRSFNNQIDMRLNIKDVVKIGQRLLKIKTNKFIQKYQNDFLRILNAFLKDHRNKDLLENIIFMVLEDAANIMKVIRGIIVSYHIITQDQFIKQYKTTNKNIYKVHDFISVLKLDYVNEQQILNIKIHVFIHNEGDQLKQIGTCSLQESQLISRKQFLLSIFSSTEFLTDYFLDKNFLNNQCIKISKSLSKKLNKTINLHINYKSLYSFINNLKNELSIKSIDEYLYTLKNYLFSNMQKPILQYLTSSYIAYCHQILLMNTFQKLSLQLANKQKIKQNRKKTKSIQEIYQQKQLIYSLKEQQNNHGLKFLQGFSQSIVNSDDNIKNVFLIQIYKSYFTNFVSQGMSFIIGYKQLSKPPTLQKFIKRQHIDKVNLVDISYILLISNYIPTNDQLNHDKIVRVFMSDLNKNIYGIENSIKDYFLSLKQQQAEIRNVNQLIPVIPSSVIVSFQNKQGKILTSTKQIDNKDQKVFQISLTKDPKFKIYPSKNQPISILNKLKKDHTLNNKINTLLQQLNQIFDQQTFKFIIEPPAKIENNLSVSIAQILGLAFYDIQSAFKTILLQPTRNQDLEACYSISKNVNIKQNLFVQLRKQKLKRNFSSLRLKISDTNQPKLKIENSQIIIEISYTSQNQFVKEKQISCKIIEQIIQRQFDQHKGILQNQINQPFSELSQHILLKLFDQLNIVKIQLEQMTKSKQIAQKVNIMNEKSYNKYQNRISFSRNRKSQLNFDKQTHKFIINFNIQIEQRQLFHSSNILTLMLNQMKENPSNPIKTKYNLFKKQIQITKYINESVVLIVENQGKLQINHKQLKSNGLSVGIIENVECLNNRSSIYWIVDKTHKHCVFNYIYKIQPQNNRTIHKKSNSTFTNQPVNLYAWNENKQINMNTCPITISIKNGIDNTPHSYKSILKQQYDQNIQVKMISKQVMQLKLTFDRLSSVSLALGGYKNLQASTQIQYFNLVVSSNGLPVFQNTKFLEVHFRGKVQVAREVVSLQTYYAEDFKQPPQTATNLQIIKPSEDLSKNVESLVYVVNNESKKYLTRAGQKRIDYIQICDGDHNAIEYKDDFQIYFKHVNDLCKIEPTIIRNGLKIGLEWMPVIRGHYLVYLNGACLNPQYEIGVAAALADPSKTTVDPPKVRKICFMQQTECTFILKDIYGNIYTELEQNLLGDALLIAIQCEQNIAISKTIKLSPEAINKYGQKKVKFYVNDPLGVQGTKIMLQVKLNMEKINQFQLQISGQSLKQRIQNLQKDIRGLNKNFHKEIIVSRHKFMEDLFTIAQKSLLTNFSVKYVGQPGIDAGGLKRQFYDMIGLEMKNQRNPFFKATDDKKNNYFLNPQILKNKKRQSYMQLFGKFTANAILNSYLLGMNFSPVFIKLLYKEFLCFQDLLSIISPEQAKRYQYLLTAQEQQFQDLDLYFVTITDKKKGIQTELKDDGANIQVTKNNVNEYLELLTKVQITQRYKDVIQSFRIGFQTVLPLNMLQKWIRPTQFWCLTQGVKELTPQLVFNYINFGGVKDQAIVAWFRRYINQSTIQVLEGFLKFASGSSSIDFNQNSKIVVTFENAGANPKKLPISHTCWKQIVVPKYKSYEIMHKLLNAAFIFCSEGFGFG